MASRLDRMDAGLDQAETAGRGVAQALVSLMPCYRTGIARRPELGRTQAGI
jgi:hypothetical protein